MQPQDQLTPNYGTQQNLPNATTTLVLGIISIVGTFCYGLGIICGIIGIIMASKDRKLYQSAPELYSQSSYSTSNAGRICSIVGTVLSAIFLIAIAAFVIFFVMQDMPAKYR